MFFLIKLNQVACSQWQRFYDSPCTLDSIILPKQRTLWCADRYFFTNSTGFILANALFFSDFACFDSFRKAKFAKINPHCTIILLFKT